MIAATMRQAASVMLAMTPATAAVAGITVSPAYPTSAMRPLPVLAGGRVQRTGPAAAPVYARQWPGGYFETAFTGTQALLRVGRGDVALRIVADGRAGVMLTRPQPGFYAVRGLARGGHRLRVQIVSESQAGPSGFLGFYAPPGTMARAIRPRSRQIEFIGDSHTVGYGNTAATRDCSEDRVWATTDTAQGIAGIVAARYGADYQVNAISGRGVVRNYDGMAADTLPSVYPFVLFDKATRYADPAWRPQVIAIALGTNDFSTPLRAGERWRNRDALHADFETTYAAFLRQLRARQPQARIVVWATDLADGEIAREARKVVERLRTGGETRIDFVPVAKLALSACHGHPSVSDDGIVAAAIGRAIDAHPDSWRRTE